MTKIDINCDMGESYGSWEMGNDRMIMPYISSANIACGFHAGDPGIIRDTIEMARDHGVSVGAHPSYPDIQGFGRREMALRPDEIFDYVLYQISAVAGICAAAGTRMNHVKPHGALYNRSAKDVETADSIAKAVRSFDKNLILYGLSGSESIKAGEKIGLKTASETFSDRTYTSEGFLTPRTQQNALISSIEDAVKQVVQMATEGAVVATSGEKVKVKADTVCIHGDGDHAAEFAVAIKMALDKEGIEVEAL